MVQSSFGICPDESVVGVVIGIIGIHIAFRLLTPTPSRFPLPGQGDGCTSPDVAVRKEDTQVIVRIAGIDHEFMVQGTTSAG